MGRLVLFILLAGGCYFDYSEAQSDGPPGVDDDAAPDSPIVDSPPPDSPPDAPIYVAPNYTSLGETGLYSDFSTKTLSADVREFSPRFKLWTDNAGKTRWLYLPPGTQIDNTDQDNWRFPIGTKVWKEFTQELGQDTLRIETRLIEWWGPGGADVWVGSFAWDATESDAIFQPTGVLNARGTNHDVPMQSQCQRCHRGMTDWILGLSAVQTSYDMEPANGTVDIMDLYNDGLLMVQPAANGYPVPGTPVEEEALGYLHANCGHCHAEEYNFQICYSQTGVDMMGPPRLSLRVYTSDTVASQTATYQTAVAQSVHQWMNMAGYTERVVAGMPSQSGLLYRMNFRDSTDLVDGVDQMPKNFTEVIDTAGVAIIENWINSL